MREISPFAKFIIPDRHIQVYCTVLNECALGDYRLSVDVMGCDAKCFHRVLHTMCTSVHGKCSLTIFILHTSALMPNANSDNVAFFSPE